MSRSRWRSSSQNVLLLVAVLLATALVGEAVLRLILDPGDFLVPVMVEDEALNFRIKPGSAGHDAWGFRNAAVPDSTDIVTIGDSQTYGWLVSGDNSWPFFLRKMTGKRVYNMAMGGYGPVQYAWLLEHHALQLRPRHIVVGFYFGNDIWDCYTVVYGRDYWASRRRPGIDPQLFEIDRPHVLGDQRQWMSQHSVLYRLLVQFIADNLAQIKLRYFYTKQSDVIMFSDPVHGVKTGLTPGLWLRALNLDDPRIAEGLRFCLESFTRMDSICQVNAVDFTVLMIPTKENVYSPCLKTGSVSRQAEVLDSMLIAERRMRDVLVGFFEEHQIAYVEALGPLQAGIGHPQLYPADLDGHPRPDGFRIIAQTVRDKILP
jgi:hypothetical protein